ncbi:hypothetical protein DFJ43DRAFT_1135315 [Lentinula guzmanii]|uniref:Uncharacterized protein n=1 Tax=Lentinula guzmanii TaxID=2804957 RepID=A0AA38JSL1_9AGAR|nr:hypothetical protein DFJ43DRAFT_1135315 [Lentinula guzmanii]
MPVGVISQWFIFLLVYHCCGTMRFNALIWAYLVLQLVSAVYAAPRFDPRAPGEEASSGKRKGPEDDGSSPAKRIKIENPSVKEESPVHVKQESPSPDIVENRPRVVVSYITKGPLRVGPQVPSWILGNQHDRAQGLIEKLVKNTAREKWGWSEVQVESLQFDYPQEGPQSWGAMVKRFFFKGPFQDCGAKEEIGCLGEIYGLDASIGYVYKRSTGRNGDQRGDLLHSLTTLNRR